MDKEKEIDALQEKVVKLQTSLSFQKERADQLQRIEETLKKSVLFHKWLAYIACFTTITACICLLVVILVNSSRSEATLQILGKSLNTIEIQARASAGYQSSNAVQSAPPQGAEQQTSSPEPSTSSLVVTPPDGMNVRATGEAGGYVGQIVGYCDGRLLDKSSTIISALTGATLVFQRDGKLRPERLLGCVIPLQIMEILSDEQGTLKIILSLVTTPLTFTVDAEQYGGTISLRHRQFGVWRVLKTKDCKKGDKVQAYFEWAEGNPSVTLKLL